MRIGWKEGQNLRKTTFWGPDLTCDVQIWHGRAVELATRQLLRALRGGRSQVAFSRRLGYRGNPVAHWEAGRRTPTAQEMLRACGRVGIDARAALARFHPTPAPESPAELHAWLDRLRGSTTMVELAKRTGHSRFTISRWLAGVSKPRVNEFLQLVEAITGRACDLVAELVSIEQVPAMQAAHRARTAARLLAHEEPWTEAIMRVLESRPYRPGEIAMQLEIDAETERRCLEKLILANIVTERDGEHQVAGELSVDTRAVPQLKAHWAAVAHARLANPLEQDLFSYNVLSVAREDLDAIRELMRATYREIRTIVSNSRSAERVALVNLQLVNWPHTQESDRE